MVDLDEVRYPSMTHRHLTQVKYSSSLGQGWQFRLGCGWARKLLGQTAFCLLAPGARFACLDPTPPFLPELVTLRKLISLIGLHGSREDCTILSNDSIFSKIISAKLRLA